MSEALIRLSAWADLWQLEINSKKCNVLRIFNHRCPPVYNIHYDLNGQNLDVLTSTKDLGVVLDNNLRFDQHISLIVHRAHQRANLILKCFQSRDRSILMRAFVTYVRPLLEYATPVWTPHHI